MNKEFEEYAKSASFRLDLSKRMIIVLLNRTGNGPEDRSLNMGVYLALQRRGLIDWHKDETGKSNGLYVTEAGKLVSKLLLMANYGEIKLDNQKENRVK